MSKLSAEAFVILANLVEQGNIVQLEKKATNYEITIFERGGPEAPHSHYQGKDLMDAISKLSS